MANSYRKATSNRKLIYFGVIAILFAATVFVRGVVAIPLSGLKEKADRFTIRSQARQLELTEYEAEEAGGEGQREAELTGSAVRLLLTGSRGFAVCVLWITAHDKQMRHEWNELELTVKSITTLQPHFVTPWLFQSWNLAYNVSVEMDRLNDMYFYISRGITLLSEGESINKYNPDMRYAIAFYYQNKFTVSDKVTTLRSLLAMSCMPAEDRNPEKYLTRVGDQIVVDEARFLELCEKYPQFVRRLRETVIKIGKTQDASGKQTDVVQILAKTPDEVVNFLRDNQKVPNRYSKDDPRRLETRLKQFPVVPPIFTNGENELRFNEEWRDAQATAVLASRAWFKYANEAIPLPDPVPGPTKFDYRDPERKRRLPRQPMLIIFRQGPPRAQTYLADQLSKEGWFDSDPWVVDKWLTLGGDKRWFSRNVEIKPSANSRDAWEEAYTMWLNHGRDNGLNLTVEQQERYRQTAALYAQKRGFPIPDSVMQTQVPPPRPDEQSDPDMQRSIEANNALSYYYRNRQVTNYETFLTEAEAEMDPLTIRARKLAYDAEREQRRYPKEAIAMYERLLGTQAEIDSLRTRRPDEDRLLWARILLNPRFTKFSEQDKIQESVYSTQIDYIRRVRDRNMPRFQQISMGLFTALRATSPLAADLPYRLAETGWVFSGRWAPATEDLPTAYFRDHWMTIPIPVFGIELKLQWTYKYLPGLSQSVEAFWPQGPFDGVNPETNKPWINELAKERVLLNAGLKKQTAPPPEAKKEGSAESEAR